MKKISLLILTLIGSILLVGCQNNDKKEQEVSSLTIKLMQDETTEIKEVTIDKGQHIRYFVPTKEGFVFIGWYTNLEFTDRVDIAEPFLENSVLYAKWQEEPTTNQTRTLTFVIKNMEDDTETVETVETPINKKASAYNPNKEGYSFKGWYLKSDFSSDSQIKLQNTVFGKDTTLYGRWELKK
ncbi:hypothetical protein BN85408940 [Alteracholeplasma palmae J233]|uniref:Uncharacterized protein n=1 Tax=Alteracholeplasma palmae (strain ATCC 49389 / J233) TaxID=1318466 RepID=U4KRV3_ALTPJ|nr:InlB B-repeat-containing protein [Alteracholeplasma palmae]CCV64471.1 hypothetical protein BN85408940 [Alteracholeplasma palmae J233]